MSDKKNPFQDLIDEAKASKYQEQYAEEEIEDIHTPDVDLVWDYSWSAFNEYYHWEIDEHDDDWETIWLSDEE